MDSLAINYVCGLRNAAIGIYLEVPRLLLRPVDKIVFEALIGQPNSSKATGILLSLGVWEV